MPERHCLSWPPTTWRWQGNRQPKSKKRAANSKLSRGRRELAKQNPPRGAGLCNYRSDLLKSSLALGSPLGPYYGVAFF